MALLIVGGFYFAGEAAYRFSTIGLFVALVFILKRVSYNREIISLYFEQEKAKEIEIQNKDSDLSQIESLRRITDILSKRLTKLDSKNSEVNKEFEKNKRDFSSFKKEIKSEVSSVKE